MKYYETITLEKRVEKHDEHITFIQDVENELQHYTEQLKGKQIYLPFDSEESSFFKWMFENFEALELKRVVATHKDSDLAIIHKVRGEKVIGRVKRKVDFLTEDSNSLLDGCDIVISNPPYSKFKDIVEKIKQHGKDFLLLGNILSMGVYTEDITTGKMKIGHTQPKEFQTKDGISKVPTQWFTSLDVIDKDEPWKVKNNYVRTMCQSNGEECIYLKKLKDIQNEPNWKGLIAAPITVLNNWEYFGKEFDYIRTDNKVMLDGKKQFKKIIIRRKQR